MCDGGGNVFGGAVALDFAREEEETHVWGAAGENVEHVLDYGAGGRGDECDGGWDGRDAAFAFAREESFCFEASFEGLEFRVEEALATGADAIDAELVGAARLVKGDDAVDFYGHAFREGNVGAKPNATHCGVGIFEGEVDGARLAFDAADLAGYQHLSDLLFEGLEDAFVELRDGDGVPGGHSNTLGLCCFAGERSGAFGASFFGRVGRMLGGNSVDFGVDEFTQTEWEAVGELVKDVSPIGLGAEDTSGDKFGQVLGNIGLGGSYEIDDFGNATG